MSAEPDSADDRVRHTDSATEDTWSAEPSQETHYSPTTVESSSEGDPFSALAEPYREHHPARRYSDFYESHSQVCDVLVEVVEAEAPIHIDVAARRVAGAWGLGRVGHVVKKVVVDAAKTASRRGRLVLSHDFLYLAGPQTIPVRRVPVGGTPRRAAHIAPEEIAEAARLVLRSHLRLTLEDLIVATARVLGFERVGSEVRTAVVAGISHLIKSGAADEANGDVVLR